MPTPKALLTSVNSDSKKGRRYVEICRAQYDKAGLDEESAQELNESSGFAAYLAAGIRKFSQKGPVFPIYIETEVGGKSKDELIAEIEASGMFASDYAKDIMSKPAWKPGEKATVRFARVKVRDLGFTANPTTTELWARIKEAGSLCEPSDGPALRIALKDQLTNDVCWTAMEQITASGGGPRVFALERRGDERWLGGDWASPDVKWYLFNEFVFRLRK